MTALGSRAGAAAAALAVAVLGWMLWPEGDEGRMRRQLDALVEELNTRPGEGFDLVARAARLSAYFTRDVVVDFGEGSTPIAGRETLVGMATRLRTPADPPTVGVEDVSVVKRAGSEMGDVSLTATITRYGSSDREAMDARELALEMRKEEGVWRISRVTAVDALR